ncbi:hypothetical protein [Halalkalicoccus subterraneus]|uniref:hypothetical protein n=1 Tax=Halalkalicoccus subterraneus TaxID=2675002 RepID=UPI000EFCF654|nr:hypothetical protein [Halalkalicoccus subterraneus]
MMAILVEETDGGEEDDSRDNRKAVLVDDLEDYGQKFEDGTAGEWAGRRLKCDPEERKECVEEQIEESEE